MRTTRVWDEEKKCYLNVCKGIVGGLTVAKFKEFRDNLIQNMKIMGSGRIEPEDLPVVPGTDKVFMINVKLPFPLTNRTIMNAMYFNDNEDGSYWQCSSSRGNEALLQEHKSKIGNNVVATNHIGYMSIKETEAGGEFASVTMSDLNGSIPSVMKNQRSTRQAK